jgi:hypothetical protein
LEVLESRRTPSVSFDVTQDVTKGPNAHSVAVADFNGDGKPDLAFADWGLKFFVDSNVGVQLNTTPSGVSAASFATAKTFAVGAGHTMGIGPHAVFLAVGDFNGDGKPDLAVANSSDGTVSILLNTTPTGASTPSFAAQQTFAVGSDPDALVVADFNGDGKPDLAVANGGGNTVSVFLNTTVTGSSTVTFTAQKTFAVGTSPFALAAADFNTDGSPDLAVANESSNTVSVLLDTTPNGSNTASFTGQKTFAVGTSPASLAATDINADGKPDLAVANFGSSFTSVLLNKTTSGSLTPSFAAQQTFAAIGHSVVAADFNGDGKPDLAGNGGAGGSVLVNTTPAMATTASFVQQNTATSGFDVLAAGDFNGDGLPDLVTGTGNEIFGGVVSVLLNTSFSAVVGQFGGQGVWEHNNDTGAWTQLTGANASVLAADSFGDIAAEFPSAGVWEFRPFGGGWHQINGVDATALAMDPQGDIVAEFPGYGVGEFSPVSGWKSLTPSNATLLAMDAQGDVAGEFPGYGIQLYSPANGWKQINGVDATLLVMDAGGDVVTNFPGYGVAEFTAAHGWTVLNGIQASALTVDAQGNVADEFAGYGVGQYVPNTGWHTLTAANAALLATDDGAVAGEFAGHGVWWFDPIHGWVQLTAAEAMALAVA